MTRRSVRLIIVSKASLQCADKYQVKEWRWLS